MDHRVAEIRYDLLPKAALESVCRQLQHGATKYGEWNWMHLSETSGVAGTMDKTWTRWFNSMIHHAFDWIAGRTKDDSGESPLAAVAANALILLELEIQQKRLKEEKCE